MTVRHVTVYLVKGITVRVVGDLEADGLLPTATTIWCGVYTDLDTGKFYTFLPTEMDNMCKFLDSVDVLIGHNFVDYDIPLMEKILGYTYTGEVVDTYILSQMFKPDRKPSHGLAAWGETLGVAKPEHSEWYRFSDEMLFRCQEDVKINVLVYKQLMRQIKE